MAEPTINVIRPQGGMHFRFPKLSPWVIILTTVILAVISVVTALYLYQHRNQAVAPTAPVSKPKAATTTTISDNFDAGSLDSATWQIYTNDPTSSVTQSGGKINVNTVNNGSQGGSGISTKQLLAGDFQAEVNISSLNSPSGSNGSAELTINNQGLGVWLAWRKNSSGSIVDVGQVLTTGTFTNFGSPINAGSTTSLKLKLVRLGSSIQAFVDLGSGYELVGSTASGYTGDGALGMNVATFSNSTSPTNASFDNFTATVNLSGAVAPTPGTAAACTVSFNVLALSATPTPGASPTPTPTPTTVPTPTPTPTPTPSSTPGATPTPTPTPVTLASPTPTPLAQAPAPTPTPVTLQKAGSATGTWVISLVGGALVVIGSVLVLAL